MDAYRDQYATIFGDDVTLFAISADADTTLASWASDKQYPFTFLSDSGAAVGRLFGAFVPNRNLTNRSLFIVKNGKIAHVMAPFREVDPQAYVELREAIQRLRGAGPQ